jgi:hypothetical protein
MDPARSVFHIEEFVCQVVVESEEFAVRLNRTSISGCPVHWQALDKCCNRVIVVVGVSV